MKKNNSLHALYWIRRTLRRTQAAMIPTNWTTSTDYVYTTVSDSSQKSIIHCHCHCDEAVLHTCIAYLHNTPVLHICITNLYCIFTVCNSSTQA